MNVQFRSDLRHLQSVFKLFPRQSSWGSIISARYFIGFWDLQGFETPISLFDITGDIVACVSPDFKKYLGVNPVFLEVFIEQTAIGKHLDIYYSALYI